MPGTLAGFGTGFVGRTDRRPDGSYITTEWLILAFLPVFPLRSYRVWRNRARDLNLVVYQSEAYFVQPVPVCKRQVAKMYGILVAVPAVTLAVVLFVGWIIENYMY
jgi:hypothetical protein